MVCIVAIYKTGEGLFLSTSEQENYLPTYVLRIFRQFGFINQEIERLLE
ncbi:hypothetical protein H6F79_21030 [Trichocoleus sp. FACHB-69]|nr:hypothetical protein [Trichocoleus sp. FACHB-69]